MPYRIIDDRTGRQMGGKPYRDRVEAEREITRWQNRWDEHGGDSGFTHEELLHAQPEEIAYFWKIINPDGTRASFGSWGTKKSAEMQIEVWRIRAEMGGRPDIPLEKVEALTVVADE